MENFTQSIKTRSNSLRSSRSSILKSSILKSSINPPPRPMSLPKFVQPRSIEKQLTKTSSKELDKDQLKMKRDFIFIREHTSAHVGNKKEECLETQDFLTLYLLIDKVLFTSFDLEEGLKPLLKLVLLYIKKYRLQ